MEKKKTIKEVAEELGVTARTIYHWIHLGKVRTVKVGRRVFIPEKEVKKLIEEKERFYRARVLDLEALVREVRKLILKGLQTSQIVKKILKNKKKFFYSMYVDEKDEKERFIVR